MPQYLYYDIVEWVAGKHPDYATEDQSLWGKGANVTLSDEETIKKTRKKSIKVVSSGTDDVFFYPSSSNMAKDFSLAYYLVFFVRISTTDNVQIQLRTDGSNYFHRLFVVSSVDTWEVFAFPIGSLASGWTSQGSPNWANINEIRLDLQDVNRTIYVDCMIIAKRYDFDHILSFAPYRPIYTVEAMIPNREGGLIQKVGVGSFRFTINARIQNPTKSAAELLQECSLVNSIHWKREQLIAYYDPAMDESELKICEIRDYNPPDRIGGIVTFYNFRAMYVEFENPD